jgi:hypothetical protein
VVPLVETRVALGAVGNCPGESKSAVVTLEANGSLLTLTLARDNVTLYRL